MKRALLFTLVPLFALSACKKKRASTSPYSAPEVAAAPRKAPRDNTVGMRFQTYELCTDLAQCQQQCTDGSPRIACGRAGSMLQKQSKHAEAAALYQRGCETLDDPLACVPYAGYLYDGQHLPQDRPKAHALNVRACEAGTMPGQAPGEHTMDPTLAIACTYAGLDLYESGRHEEAFTRFQYACDGSAMGCRYLAVSYRDGVGTAQDPTKADATYRKACEQGDGPSCFDIAVEILKQTPEGTPAPDARSHLARSCSLGFAKGCTEHGRALMFGLGGPVDFKGGKAVLDDACGRLREPGACEIVKELGGG